MNGGRELILGVPLCLCGDKYFCVILWFIFTSYVMNDYSFEKIIRKRYNLIFEGEILASVNYSTKRKLEKLLGKVQDDDEIKKEVYEIIYHESVEYCLRYLSISDRTEFEVRRKLAGRNYPQKVIVRTVKYMKRYSYINDGKYIKNFIKKRIKGGYGKYRIKFELRRKGIDLEGQDFSIFSILDEKLFYEKILCLARKKVSLYRKKLDKEKKKRRIYGFLKRRGIESHIIFKVLKELF